jgi:hypothetical protein
MHTRRPRPLGSQTSPGQLFEFDFIDRRAGISRLGVPCLGYFFRSVVIVAPPPVGVANTNLFFVLGAG